MKCGTCGFENEPGALFCGSCGERLDSGGFSFGPYELRGELGRGAMARVWRAWDPNLGREVAIKEPLFDAGLGDGVLQEMGRRFVREAQTAARLSHSGIVAVYAADVYDNRPAIVMELVDGATLGDILENGPLAPDAALDALDQLLDAVGYAHANGVVHRDIKPENIFVDSEGRVKLADFGIAHADDDVVGPGTMMGTVLGSPGYMSPEQARGATADARSDLFSIGVVAYEMLTGRNPFGASEGADVTTLLYRTVHEPAPNLPASCVVELPAGAWRTIMASLEKDPVMRPQSAAAFKRMLHDGYGGSGGDERVEVEGGSQDGEASSGKATALPYAVVAIGVILVLVLLFNAGMSGGGGGGGGSTPGIATSASSQSRSTSSAAPVSSRSTSDSQSASAGASESFSGSSPASSAEGFMGVWHVVEIKQGSKVSVSRSEMEMTRSLGEDVLVILNEDGSASLDVFGDMSYGNWSALTKTEGTLTLANRVEGDDPIMAFEHVSLVLSGDTLLLEQDDAYITCERNLS